MLTKHEIERLWSDTVEEDALVIDEETRCGCLVLYKWGKIVKNKSQIDMLVDRLTVISNISMI